MYKIIYCTIVYKSKDRKQPECLSLPAYKAAVFKMSKY